MRPLLCSEGRALERRLRRLPPLTASLSETLEREEERKGGREERWEGKGMVGRWRSGREEGSLQETYVAVVV